MEPKVNMIYWISAKMGKPLAGQEGHMRKARRMASKFSMDQLNRLFKIAGRKQGGNVYAFKPRV